MPASANVANSRLGPPTRVHSSSSSSVEELPSGAGVTFDGGTFGYYGEPSSFDRGGGGDRQQSFSRHPGRFNASTQAFASLLESGGGAEVGGPGGGDSGSVRVSGLLSKAIKIYETNAKIVSGEINILGTSVSLVL